MIQTRMEAFGAGNHGWNLHEGTGPRYFVSDDISFQPPFGAPPQVAVSLCGFQAGAAQNYITVNNVQVVNLKPTEFNIRVEVADDTLLYNVNFTWIAFD